MDEAMSTVRDTHEVYRSRKQLRIIPEMKIVAIYLYTFVTKFGI